MKNKANLKPNKFIATLCSRTTYSVLHPKTQNGTKPNKANSKKEKPQTKSETQTKDFFMESKANFKNQQSTATTCITEVYINLHPQFHQKSKPNPNPIQSQFLGFFKNSYRSTVHLSTALLSRAKGPHIAFWSRRGYNRRYGNVFSGFARSAKLRINRNIF